MYYLDVDGWSQSLFDIGHGKVPCGNSPVHYVIGIDHGHELERQSHLLDNVAS